MRCKRHGTDLSSIVGVCASCLRERLFRLILAQEQAQTQSIEPNPTLRRSVSPYISRVESVNSVNPVVTAQRPYNNPRLIHSQSDKRFYSSPQIALNTGGCIGGRSCSSNRKQTAIRFPSISNLFRSNSRNGVGDPDSNRSESCDGGGGRLSSVTSSRSWFSNVLPGAGDRQKSKGLHIDEASTGVVRRRRCFRDRGMSPVRFSDEDEFSDGTSDCQSAESCKQTPMKTPSTVRRGGGRRSVTELIFCSLVHASPNRLMNLKPIGKPPVGGGFSGDARSPAVPHLAYTKSFSGNRSRKLADFGRCDLNR